MQKLLWQDSFHPEESSQRPGMSKFLIFSTAREALFLLMHPALWFRDGLKRVHFADSPFDQFEKWYGEAKRCWLSEFPNWMCLSTVTEEGTLQGRIVLMKDFDRRGVLFYTNFESGKGRALLSNPSCAVTFFWERLQRQLRIEGEAHPVSDEEADQYFHSRPRSSQIGAWASDQSRECQNRDELEDRYKEFKKKFEGKEVPRPPHWSGFRITPKRFEFWQLRLSRLHDRIEYVKDGEGWTIRRLYP